MKKVYTLLTVIYMAVASYGQNCADTANIYRFSFNGKNYEIVKEMKSWADAADCAVERGGYLVQIDNQAEQETVYDAIINGAGISVNYTSVPDGGGIAYVWIGATDAANEGTWLWDGDSDGVGINFWNGQGNAGTGGGSAVGGMYINWGGIHSGTPNEPDDFMSNQDGAAIGLANWPYGIAGEWNDINVSNNLYYVIEYDTSGTTGLNSKNPGYNDVVLYPNPCNGVFRIKTANRDKQAVSVRIFNHSGAILYEQDGPDTREMQIDLSGVKPGIFFVNIVFENGIVVNRKIEIK